MRASLPTARPCDLRWGVPAGGYHACVAQSGASFERGGGGGSGTQRFVYQKWPLQIFAVLNFVFAKTVTLVGGGSRGEGGGAFIRPDNPPL